MMPVVNRPINLLVLMDSSLEVSPVSEFLMGQMDQKSVGQAEPLPMGSVTGATFTVTVGGGGTMGLEVKTSLAPVDSLITQELQELIRSADGFMVCSPVGGDATDSRPNLFALLEEELKTIGKSFRTVPSVVGWFGGEGETLADVEAVNGTWNRFGAPYFHISSNDAPQLVTAFATCIRIAVKKVAEDLQAGMSDKESTSGQEPDLADLLRILDELVGPDLN